MRNCAQNRIVCNVCIHVYVYIMYLINEIICIFVFTYCKHIVFVLLSPRYMYVDVIVFVANVVCYSYRLQINCSCLILPFADNQAKQW